MLLGPMSVLATKEQATPHMEKEQSAAKELCLYRVGLIFIQEDLRDSHGELLQVVGGK